jgi:serine/threonine protein kinase
MADRTITEDEATFFLEELAASVRDAKGDELHEIFGSRNEQESRIAATRRNVKELVLAHEREQFRRSHEGQKPGQHDENGGDTGSSVDLTGELVDRRYRLTRVIGRGDLGHLYEGEHIALRRRVAVTVLYPQHASDKRLRERFLQEARAASEVRHPNLVEINDYGEAANGLAYVVMEALDGHDVRTELQLRATLSWARTRCILLQAANALYAAHIRRIIHRDIKPEYCFITRAADGTDHVKIFGFGGVRIGCYEHVDAQGTALTGSGEVFGTVGYMAPEQARGAMLDARSDIYSLGIMAYEMLVGHVPFIGVNAIHIITRHLNDTPKPLRSLNSTIPEAVEELVLRMIAKEPSERFDSMKALEAAIQRIPPDEVPGRVEESRVPARKDGLDAAGTSSTGFTLVKSPRHASPLPLAGVIPTSKPSTVLSPPRLRRPISAIAVPAMIGPRAESVLGTQSPGTEGVAALQVTGHRRPMLGTRMTAIAATSPRLPKRSEAGVVIGGYELVRRIGRGGMAEVWVARKALGKKGTKFVAIKLLADHYVGDERYARMFRSEAELAAVLSHANIVQVFDEGEEDGRSYLIMEWVDGLNLLKLGDMLALLDDDQRRFRVTSYIIGQLLHALNYAHSITLADGNPLGVVHRDVSPQNVLVSNHGEVKLTDFGVAYYNFEESSGIHVKGKVRYMAPEQLSGKTRSPTVDLYAVGALLHELLDGRRFRGEFDDGQDLFSVVLSGRVSELSRSVPPELDRLRLALLEPDATRRIQSAEQAVTLLKRYPGYGDARDELTKLCGSLTGVVRPRVGPGQSSQAAAADQLTTWWGARKLGKPKVDNGAGRPPPAPPRPVVARSPKAVLPTGSTTAVRNTRCTQGPAHALITGQTEFVRLEVVANADVQGQSSWPIQIPSMPIWGDPNLRPPLTEVLSHSVASGAAHHNSTEVLDSNMIIEMSGSGTDQEILPPARLGDGSDTRHEPRAGMSMPSNSVSLVLPKRSALVAIGLGLVMVAVMSVSVTWLLFTHGRDDGPTTDAAVPAASIVEPEPKPKRPEPAEPAELPGGLQVSMAADGAGAGAMVESVAFQGAGADDAATEETAAQGGVEAMGGSRAAPEARAGTPPGTATPAVADAEVIDVVGEQPDVELPEKPKPVPPKTSSKPKPKAGVKVLGGMGFDKAQVKIGSQVLAVDGRREVKVPVGKKTLQWRRTAKEPWKPGGSWTFTNGKKVIIFVGKDGPKARYISG